MFRGGISERKKIDTYVQTNCQVTNSSLEECGVEQSKQGKRQCYRLEWRIRYVEYRTHKRATITHSGHYLERETHFEDELWMKLRRYKVYIVAMSKILYIPKI